MPLPTVPSAPNRSLPSTFRANMDDFLAWMRTVFVDGIGYGTGAGGQVTQITSRVTGVTLNKPCGTITLVSAAGSPTWSSFVVTNFSIEITDTIIVTQRSGANSYQFATKAGAGSFTLSVSAFAGTATEAPNINFAIIKSVST
ncbi:hypothetical protein [Cypionkella sp.]|uniref:hypothetical protein n=1 Tax=Cypionkella sp. TaxID=2811411 RepID=UPI002AB91F37|nr:hypothetical protein [Cypionkella sp.]MDZ4392505.1 hypothetical protein [Cypionkella sp.]